MDGTRIRRPASNFKFRLSVYGILIEDGKLLFQKNPNLEALCIPGGGVDMHENFYMVLEGTLQYYIIRIYQLIKYYNV